MRQTDYDLIVIGGGPAGLTAGQYGARANLKTAVVEQMAPGGQALLIDVLENYPGNVAGGEAGPRSGFQFAQDLQKQAEDFGAVIVYDTAAALKKEGGVFEVELASGKTVSAAAVIYAAGSRYRTLGVPGEEALYGRGVSYCATCDGPFFKGKKIFVAGGGDAACDEAQYLSRLTDRVVLVHRREKFRAQKALAARVLANPAIEVRFNTVVKEVRGDKKVSSLLLGKTDGAAPDYTEEADALFVFAGTIPQTDMLRPAGVELDEAGYVVTGQDMAANAAGLYAAGDVRSGAFRQVVVACGEGAAAAHHAAKYIGELRGERY